MQKDLNGRGEKGAIDVLKEYIENRGGSIYERA